MAKKIVHVPLTRAGINNAIKELRDYQKWLTQKQKEFLDALAQEGLQVAESGFANAVYDGTNDVVCRIEDLGEKKRAVVATGHTDPTGTDVVLFIEFGTGILYPDDHPEAAENGMIRGEYGYGRGKNIWGWTYEAGEPGTNGQVIYQGHQKGRIHTFGNPANKAMFRSKTELEERFADIARRVFTR